MLNFVNEDIYKDVLRCFLFLKRERSRSYVTDEGRKTTKTDQKDRS